jgi:hypothetical protein
MRVGTGGGEVGEADAGILVGFEEGLLEFGHFCGTAAGFQAVGTEV